MIAETAQDRRNAISKTLMQDMSKRGMKIEDYFSKFEKEFQTNELEPAEGKEE